MSVKKILLVSVGLMSLQMNALALNCATDCTKDVACKFKFKVSQCVANCPGFTLDVCSTKVQEAPPVQASLEPAMPTDMPPSLPEPTATTEEVIKQSVGQNKPQPPKRPQAIRLQKSPIEAPGEPKQASEFSYTSAEVNQLLKGILTDQIKEITTGCDSAIGKIHGGLEMVKVDQSPEAVDLLKRGTGFIALFMKEKKDAQEWVEAFNVNKQLTEEDLKKYGIKQADLKEKLTLEVMKQIYQKSQEKSLLVSQDCKVKSAQFQGWLEAYLVKKSVNPDGKKKLGLFDRFGNRK